MRQNLNQLFHRLYFHHSVSIFILPVFNRTRDSGAPESTGALGNLFQVLLVMVLSIVEVLPLQDLRGNAAVAFFIQLLVKEEQNMCLCQRNRKQQWKCLCCLVGTTLSLLTSRHLFFCSGCELSVAAMFCDTCNNKFLLFKEHTGDWLTEEKSFSSFFCSLAPLLSVGRGIKADPISLRTLHLRTLERRFQALENQNKHSLTLNNTEEYLLCRRGFLCLIIHLQLSVDLWD